MPSGTMITLLPLRFRSLSGTVTIPATGRAIFGDGVAFNNQGTLTATGTQINSTLVNSGVMEIVGTTVAQNLTNDGTLTVTGGTFAGKMTGAGLALAKVGSATLTLSTANDFGGGTSVSNGTLQLSPASPATVVLGAVMMNGGTLSGAATIGGRTGSGGAA